MSKFYLLMVILLVIAIINILRALKAKSSKGKVLGITINAIAIVLIVTALIISLT